MQRRLTIATLAGLAVVAVSGCSATATGTATTANATTTVATSPSSDANSSLVNEPFGAQYSGATLAVGVSKPTLYTPSDSALVQQQTGRAVAFDITITNQNSTQPFPLMALDYQATSGSTQDQEIQDSANNVGTSTATVLPGKTLTWKVAFSVPANASDLTVAISSMGGGKTIVFSGTV